MSLTTSFMMPAPHPNRDELMITKTNVTLNVWYDMAGKNREIFTVIFRPFQQTWLETGLSMV